MSRSTPFSRDADTLVGLATALDTAYRFRKIARVARPATVARMAAVAQAGAGTAGTLRSNRSRRHQRRAAHHAQRALIRSYRIGPSRSVGDRRIRAELIRACSPAGRSSAWPEASRHTS